MKISFTLALTSLLLLATSSSHDLEAFDGDSRELLGNWIIISVEFAGQPVAGLEGSRLLFSRKGKKSLLLPNGVVEKGTYTVDTGRKPAWMDATTSGRPGTARGIFAIEGKALKICLSQGGGSRPDKFVTQAGTDFLLLMLEREKKSVESPGKKTPRQARVPGTRCFYLGFTGFPHDISLEAVAEARMFLREHADIVAHHIEGVPWAECLRGAELPAKLLDDWRGKRQATPAKSKVYLAISPGRGDLKVSDKAMPLPSELVGKSYDHPLVKRAYLEYCKRSVAFFQPDFLLIGIEVNEIWDAGTEKWRAYVNLHQHVYKEIKKKSPTLPIFASFTLHGLLNKTGAKRQAMLGAAYQIIPACDLIGISFYPFIRGGTTDITGAFKWWTEHFDRFGKTYAMVETGEAAQKLVFPSTGQVIQGTLEKQAAYYEQLLAFAQEQRLAFVISFLHRDYDAMWEKIKEYSPEVFMAWRDCGLVDEQGKKRPAFEIWKRYERLTYKRAKSKAGK